MEQKFKLNPIYFVFIIVMLITISSCTTNNWSQFRGADFNMVVSNEKLPTEWNDSLNVKWTYDIEGDSWSSPIVYGDKVFISTAILVKKAPVKVQEPVPATPQNQENGDNPPPPPPPAEDKSFLEDVYRWEVTCVDLKTGNELWKQVAFEGNPRIKKHAGSNYACETPVTDGNRVYVYFGMVGVYCYDLSGNFLWEQDLGAYETLNGWGTGSSPVIFNDVLFVQVDNDENSFIVALDAASGEEKWKVDREETTTYSSPVIWENSVRAELVALGKTARSYNLETGDILWETKVDSGMTIPSPVFDAEHIYFGNVGENNDLGSLFAVKAGAEGDITPAEGETTSSGVVWLNSDAGTSNPSPLIHNGLIYILASRGGEVTCIDATNGELVYKEKVENVGACWASPWINNDKIYFYDEKGVTQILKTGKEFEVLSQNSLDDKFWASVAPTKDAYIFKGEDKLYCVGK